MKKIRFLALLIALVTLLIACQSATALENPDAYTPDPSTTLSTAPSTSGIPAAEPSQPSQTAQPTFPSQPPKIICTYTLEDEFEDNKILVIVYPQWNQKEYTVDDFTQISCIAIEEIFKPKQNESPSRIFELTLDQHSKENVLECIRILEQREDVYCAEPDGYMYPA